MKLKENDKVNDKKICTGLPLNMPIYYLLL